MSPTTAANLSADLPPEEGSKIRPSPIKRSFCQTLRTLWRAYRVRENEELSKEDAASTLFRFFRSEHVADLELIANLSVGLFVIYFFFILSIAVLPNHHDTDAIGAALKVMADNFGPAIPICGGIVAWAYLSASTRLGVVDLFACEISTLCRVGTIFDIGKRYVAIYHSTDDISKKHAAVKRVGAHHAPEKEPPRAFVSQESYFPVFESNSKDLESLEALVVQSITQYYTYMKAMHDLQRKLAAVEPSELSDVSQKAQDGSPHVDEWHQTLANIIYVLFLGYESARKAISDLVEFEPVRAEDTIIILMTELVCFAFLCHHLLDDEVRFERLVLRESDYDAIIPPLIAKVNADHGDNEKNWMPAKRLVSELKARYDAARETLKKCRAGRLAKSGERHSAAAR